jgi:hypothetical protein
MPAATNDSYLLFLHMLGLLRRQRQWSLFLRGCSDFFVVMSGEATLVLLVLFVLAYGGYLQTELCRPLSWFLAEMVVALTLCYGVWQSLLGIPSLANLAEEVDATYHLHGLLASGCAIACDKQRSGLAPLVLLRAITWLQTEATHIYTDKHLKRLGPGLLLIIPWFLWQIPLADGALPKKSSAPRPLLASVDSKTQESEYQPADRPPQQTMTPQTQQPDQPAMTPRTQQPDQPTRAAEPNPTPQKRPGGKDAAEKQQTEPGKDGRQHNEREKTQPQPSTDGDGKKQETMRPQPSPQKPTKESSQERQEPQQPSHDEKPRGQESGQTPSPGTKQQNENGKEVPASKFIPHAVRPLFADGEKWLSQQGIDTLTPDAAGSEEVSAVPPFFYQAEQFLRQTTLSAQHQEAIRRYLDLIRPPSTGK